MTKQDYLEQSEYPELAKAVLKQLDISWGELTENINNYLNAEGGVHGFIYYTETYRFYKDNIEFIDRALIEASEEGLEFTTEQILDSNWKAWFALETITHEIYRMLEGE